MWRTVLLLLALPGHCLGEQSVSATNATYVEWIGRPYAGPTAGSVSFQWLGTGVRVKHTGTTLRALIGTNATRAYKLMFAQGEEGYFPYQGQSWVSPSDAGGPGLTIGSGPGDVRAALNTPPQYFAEEESSAEVVGFHTDGVFVAASPPATPRRVLHFLGDSITAATNVHGGFPGCADRGYQADWAASYSGVLCNWLDADCSVVAVGGKGLVRNCCDDGLLMPDYYARYGMTSAQPDFPFNDTVPAGVVVYLGTNDFDKGATPALTAQFTAALLTFMTNVTRVWYGTPSSPANVTFFAVLGPMSPTLPAQAVTDAVNAGTAQGLRVILVNGTSACGADLTGCTDGCAGHPGVASHRALSNTLLPIVEQALGWTPAVRGGG